MWSSSSSPSEGSSNLQRFLRSVTPFVPSKPVPQHQGGIHEVNSQWHCGEYFSLGELWGCYDEWSAYGAGTQVVLNNGEDVVQYYVPYLSGIQIYTRNPIREDSGEEVEFWSDDSESDKLSRSLSNNSNKTWDVASGDTNIDHEMSRLGNLYFQYFDTCSPYWRIPLVERIIEFAENHSGLFTLKSVDLSPASWMAVAWYPIYHIPTKGSLKDLSACFLSYHTLSSSFQDTAVGNGEEIAGEIPCSELGKEVPGLGRKCKGKMRGKICLPPFGLATYRLQGDLWTSDYDRLIDLQSAAASWLRRLNVQHHDFNFFTSHSTMETFGAIEKRLSPTSSRLIPEGP